MVKRIHPFRYRPRSFPQLSLDSEIASPFRFLCMRGKGRLSPLRSFLSHDVILSFSKSSAENTQLWRKSLLSNKLSKINIAKLISFLTENENVIKQPLDATSSSDSFIMTSDLRTKTRTLISPPTTI
ncbi:hypothetical protein AVEN_92215-1 [Araneus ventricosus]|uniref:Uncharacterized protein n=1 Tax=Araneus ventricosus TaxID=182803 RepID=A0A4Y2AM17_ARAVE|nr:hypothetical protein AVEN_92215-1 [Araneus ventricosus]